MLSLELQKTLQYEGGYTDDESDPGGETKFGISKNSFPGVDIPKLTIEDAGALYKEYYWDKLKCDSILDKRVRWKLFDNGVCLGISESAKMVQKIVGSIVDGVIGDN